MPKKVHVVEKSVKGPPIRDEAKSNSIDLVRDLRIQLGDYLHNELYLSEHESTLFLQILGNKKNELNEFQKNYSKLLQDYIDSGVVDEPEPQNKLHLILNSFIKIQKNYDGRLTDLIGEDRLDEFKMYYYQLKDKTDQELLDDLDTLQLEDQVAKLSAEKYHMENYSEEFIMENNKIRK